MRWLAEDAAAVKNGRCDGFFLVSPQQMPISQNLSYIYPNEICHGTIETSNELKHSSLPCDELGRVIASIKTRIFVPR